MKTVEQTVEHLGSECYIVNRRAAAVEPPKEKLYRDPSRRAAHLHRQLVADGGLGDGEEAYLAGGYCDFHVERHGQTLYVYFSGDAAHKGSWGSCAPEEVEKLKERS